jgi:hypothetical protein
MTVFLDKLQGKNSIEASKCRISQLTGPIYKHTSNICMHVEMAI